MILLYLFLNAIAIGLTFYAKQQLQSFLRQHPTIADFKSLAAFKALARSNMYLALGQLGLLGSSLVLGLYLLYKSNFLMLPLILCINGLVYFISQNIKTLEENSRNLECATLEITQIYQNVCKTWVKKPFPDF
jgi:hypothetical protein